MHQTPPRKLIRIGIVLIVGLVALGLRLNFAQHQKVGEDEPTYLTSALSYTNILRSGNFRQVARHEENPQHPVLSKLLYGAVLLTQPPLDKMHNRYFTTGLPIENAQGRPWGMAARYTSVIIGTITSIVIAVVDPLAGLFFATQSLIAISTSLVSLEPLPLFTSFLSVLFYLKWAKQNLRADGSATGTSGWLTLSAFALGVTAASKYTYCIVGVSILLHYLIHCARQPKLLHLLPKMAVWAALSGLVFFIFDPYLWPDPVVRLRKSLLFHIDYPGSPSVNGTDLPFWQPLVWLSTPFSSYLPIPWTHFVIGPDRLIFILALLGLPGLWRRGDGYSTAQAKSLNTENSEKGKGQTKVSAILRLFSSRLEGSDFYLIWIVTGLAAAMAWPTKWPQYVLIIMVPVCLSASLGARMVYNWVKKRLF